MSANTKKQTPTFAPPPAADEAERACLGAMLTESAAIAAAKAEVSAEDFGLERHSTLFNALCEVGSCDPVLLQEHLASRGLLEKVGGAAYMLALPGDAPTAGMAAAYARRVREAANLRRVQAASWRFAEKPNSDNLKALGAVIAAAESRSNLRPISGAELRVYKCEAKYLAKDLLPFGLVILAGEPGLGKSLLGISLATSVASGRPWLDTFEVEAGRVLAIDAEGNEAFTAERWRKLDGAEQADDAVSFLFQPPRLIGGEHGELRAILRDLRPSLVIFDSLAALLADGIDENDNAAMRRALDPLRNLAHELGFCALLIHHLRKVQQFGDRQGLSRIRGAGAIADVADGAFIVSEDRTTGHLVIKPEKTRWGAKPQAFSVAFDPTPEGLLAVTFAGLVGEREEAQSKQAEAACAIVEALDAGPLTWGNLRDIITDKGFSEQTFRRALDDLKKQQFVKSKKEGRNVIFTLP